MTELGYRQPFSPIVLLLIDKDAEVLFNILIHSFRLPVSGQVKGGRSILLDAEEVKQTLDVFVDELRIMIMYDLSQKSTIVEDSVSKGLCKPFCGKFNMGCFELDILGKSINDDKNCIIAI
jgi:hypothetical protein